MEDSCAVCAEPLEWISYGPCGHREVCFTCIARLRFVLKDKSCCICKRHCPTVFITKALGAYTRVVTDWESLLNDGNRSGQRNFWYDSVLEAYFDDEGPFKIIKAMCTLYCSICERAAEGERESVANGMMQKGHKFKNIDSLRHHQSTVHKVFMCQLCLEGRKVFTSEQKLYSKTQLYLHSRRGDSEVDHDNEEEQGQFSGHPICHFCRKPFYGDNELYQHMSRAHYTCHICQRVRPGHYEYFANYDNLEAHFRQRHLLCDNHECLAKKFVVFPSESELKRHNATTHGKTMSRSQKNAALQLPVSFQYRPPGQECRRVGRYQDGRLYPLTARHDRSLVLPVSGGSENLENAVPSAASESCVLSPSCSNEPSATMDSQGITSQIRGSADIEPRYIAAVVGSRPSALGDSAFPPLPGSSNCAQHRVTLATHGPASMATLIGGIGSMGGARAGIQALNAVDAPAGFQTSQAHNSFRPTTGNDSIGLAHSKVAVNSTQPSPVAIQRANNYGRALNITNGILDREMDADANQQSSKLLHLSVEEIRTGNKALVQRIRAGFEGNEQKFEDFKVISSLYRKGGLSSKEYYFHIACLGLSYVVPDLAKLCPDSSKGKELMELHNAGLQLTKHGVDPTRALACPAGSFSSSSSIAAAPTVNGSSSYSGISASRAPATDARVEVLFTDGYRNMADSWSSPPSISCTIGVDAMRSSERQMLNEHAAARDHTPPLSATPPLLPNSSHTPVSEKPSAVLDGGWVCGSCRSVNTEDFRLCAVCGATKHSQEAKGGVSSSLVGNERTKKKAAKFERVRLGAGSASSSLDSTASPVVPADVDNGNKNSSKSRCRGVWKNGGGQRLFQ